MRQAAVLLMVCCVGFTSGCRRAPQAKPEPKDAAPPVAEQTEPAAAEAKATPVPVNRNAQVIVLGYHRVVDNVHRPDTEITKADFEKQMQQLKDEGITVIPMRDFLAWKRGEKDIPAKSAVLTFDDGWKSQYEAAWPILRKFNYPFTLFIYTDYVKGGPKSGGESITWEQIAELRDAGADIEGHTVSHKDLRGPTKRGGAVTPEYDAWLWNELNGSKQALEQRLGVKIEALAVPFGFYNAHVQEVAKKAGYDAIFTVYGQKIGYGSPNNSLGRYMIEANKPKVFASAVRFGSGVTSASEPVAEFTGNALKTEPADNATIGDSRPVIKVSTETFGNIDPASLTMRVSSLGTVNAQYDAAAKSYSYQPPHKLNDNRYSVIVSGKADGKKVEARWGFNLDSKAAKPQ
jgi:peptidoglycan/xylan/chitin deacetylase (PgdA/CDA1 family)